MMAQVLSARGSVCPGLPDNSPAELAKLGMSHQWQGEGAAEGFWASRASVATSEAKTVISTGQSITLPCKPVDSFGDSSCDYILLINIRDFGRVMANCPAEFIYIPLHNLSPSLKLSSSLTDCLLIWTLSFSSFSSASSSPFLCMCLQIRASLVGQTVKNPLAMQETWVPSLGGEDPLEEGVATHSSVLAWRIPWTEEPGGLQSTGLQRVRQDWATST